MLNYEKIKWKYLLILFGMFTFIFLGRLYIDNQKHQEVLSIII
ncbi:MAG: hypothetical protein U9N59_13255 [Campylobacterota bacterium]|nr:hypothetical protein [Campylobacterota bacterium]